MFAFAYMNGSIRKESSSWFNRPVSPIHLAIVQYIHFLIAQVDLTSIEMVGPTHSIHPQAFPVQVPVLPNRRFQRRVYGLEIDSCRAQPRRPNTLDRRQAGRQRAAAHRVCPRQTRHGMCEMWRGGWRRERSDR